MTTIPDHYAALGIDPTADPEVITAAYRALAKKFHPDTGSAAGTADAARFDAVQQAYEVLRNPESRHAYDLELLAATEAELEAHIASKRRVVLRERTAEQARAAAPPPPDLGDIRPEPAAPPRARPAPRRGILPFAVPLLLVMLLGGGAAWLFLPDGPAAPPLPGSAKQDAQAVTEPAAPAPDTAPAVADAPATPPADAQAGAPASETPPVFGSAATETPADQAAETAAAAPVPADAPVFGSSGTLDAATAVEAPPDAPKAEQPSAPPEQQQAAPPPLPKAKPAAPVKQAQKPAPQKKPQAQPRARVAIQDPPQYYPEPDGYPPPPPGMEPPGFGPDPYAPPGYDQGFLPGRGPYRLVIFERQPGRPATAWSAGVVFKSIGKCTKQGVKAVLRRTGGDPYGDGTRIWYECQRLSQR